MSDTKSNNDRKSMTNSKMKAISAVVSVIQKVLYVVYKLPFIGYYLDLWSLWIVGLARFGCGVYLADGIEECKRPEKLLILYEYEGCPFCKKVREVLSFLDLDAMIIPCPRENMDTKGYFSNASRYRQEAKKLGGKVQFPLLIDNNNQTKEGKALIMYESDSIIAYLMKTYGDKAKPRCSYTLASSPLKFVLLPFITMLRVLPEHGLMRIPSKKPKEPLVLWSFEPSPFCKKVREILCSLEIKYILRNCGRYSPKRQEFMDKYGSMISKWRKNANLIQVPLLEDPNTNKVLLESEEIRNYLIDTYQIDPSSAKEE